MIRRHPILDAVVIALVVLGVAIVVGITTGDDSNDSAAVATANEDSYSGSFGVAAWSHEVRISIRNDGTVPFDVFEDMGNCAKRVTPGFPFTVQPGRGLDRVFVFSDEYSCNSVIVIYSLKRPSGGVPPRIVWTKSRSGKPELSCRVLKPGERCEVQSDNVVVVSVEE